MGTTVVLDTCVLLADPDSLYAFGDADIVIPLTVIEELDGHKSRLDDVGRAARHVVRDLERLRVDSGGDFREPVALPTGGTVRVTINGLVVDQIAGLGLNPEK
ncbi:MAG TPA: PIN domain-containing protein, partial [Acidimicrobiia bacterium]|nr:PIN domain-containing protein [Acidimicrobiia bacterium]